MQIEQFSKLLDHSGIDITTEYMLKSHRIKIRKAHRVYLFLFAEFYLLISI